MKWLILAILLPVLLFGSFFVNVYVHEYGHYAVADYYGLNPEIHFNTEPISDYSKLSLYSPAAYTSYSSDSTEYTTQDATIALAGPLVNLAFALIIYGIYLAIPKKKRNFWVQACFAMLVIPAFMSFVINIAPIGFSDGSIILAALGF